MSAFEKARMLVGQMCDYLPPPGVSFEVQGFHFVALEGGHYGYTTPRGVKVGVGFYPGSRERYGSNFYSLTVTSDINRWNLFCSRIEQYQDSAFSYPHWMYEWTKEKNRRI